MLLLIACHDARADNCEVEDAKPISLHPDYPAGARYGNIRLLGSLVLSTRSVDELPVHGLSGLAWSAARRQLYALSDLGFIVRLAPHFAGGVLVGASYCAAFALRDASGAPLTGSWRDSEGLRLRPATENAPEQLLISFEQHPRLERYSVEGRYLGSIPLPPLLRNISHYANPNRALEAVTETRRFGIILAPELPLRDPPSTEIPLLAMNGRRWDFHSLDREFSGLVDMETLPDDNLLVLERRYISPLHPLIVALSYVKLANAAGLPAHQQELARFDTSAGWAIDNFEGLARHEGNRYFMVSDDNASPLQHNLLVYFEVLANDPPSPAPAAPLLSKHHL